MIRKITLGQIVSVCTIIGFLITAYLYIDNNEKRAEAIRTQYAVDKDREIRQRDSIFQIVTAQGVQINELKTAFSQHDAKDIISKGEFDVRMDANEQGLKILETRFNDLLYFKLKK